MNCCNDFGQCTQGPDCPVRATPSTMFKTCDDLGVCQNQDAECPRQCQLLSQLSGMTPYDSDALWQAETLMDGLYRECYSGAKMLLVYGTSAFVSCLILGWLWARFA